MFSSSLSLSLSLSSSLLPEFVEAVNSKGSGEGFDDETLALEERYMELRRENVRRQPAPLPLGMKPTGRTFQGIPTTSTSNRGQNIAGAAAESSTRKGGTKSKPSSFSSPVDSTTGDTAVSRNPSVATSTGSIRRQQRHAHASSARFPPTESSPQAVSAGHGTTTPSLSTSHISSSSASAGSASSTPHDVSNDTSDRSTGSAGRSFSYVPERIDSHYQIQLPRSSGRREGSGESSREISRDQATRVDRDAAGIQAHATHTNFTEVNSSVLGDAAGASTEASFEVRDSFMEQSSRDYSHDWGQASGNGNGNGTESEIEGGTHEMDVDVYVDDELGEETRTRSIRSRNDDPDSFW